MKAAVSGSAVSWLDALVHLGASQPIAEPVPSDDAFYLQSKGRLHVARRTLRRLLQLRFSGQRALLREHIEPRWKRALWVHAEAPQIGDALMDLAPRSLLAEHGIAVDIFSPAAIAKLLTGDRWLQRSLSDPAALNASHYDFVICTSHSAESLAVKRARLAGLPWVSIKGLYQGYDYHRAGLVARRLSELMRVTLVDDAYRFHSRQKLSRIGEALVPGPGGASSPVAIAVGGVRAERTYPHWPAVVQALHRGGVRSLVLIGSANGLQAATEVIASAPAGMAITNHVDQLDLHATRGAIARARLLICADGGLMHLGFTTLTPVLALFTQAIDPAWRVPLGFDGATLRSSSPELATIDSAQIAGQALQLLGRG